MITRHGRWLVKSGHDAIKRETVIIHELLDEVEKLTRDRDWWRSAATGELWLKAIDDDLEEDPF